VNPLYVIKLSGKVTDRREDLVRIAHDIEYLNKQGVQIVVVHGGGKQLDGLAGKLGIVSETIEGRRVTSAATLELATMVYAGKVNTAVTSALVGKGLAAVGLSGVSCGLVTATRRNPTPVDYGFVGDITSVDVSLLHLLLAHGHIPVIASLGVTKTGEVLNINADTIAAALASNLGADRVVLVSDVDGIYASFEDEKTRIGHISLEDAKNLFRSEAIFGGMKPKLKAVIELIESGIANVHIVSGQTSITTLGQAIGCDRKYDGPGTLITRSL